MSCGCESTTPCVQLCDECESGCPLQLDFDCLIYHKDGSEVSQLTNLDLPNGSTLTTIVEKIDYFIGQINVQGFALPILVGLGYTINTLQQFCEAVDTEIGNINTAIAALGSQTPITPTDSETIDLTVSGVNNHTIRADVNLSGVADNQIVIHPTGLYAAPQNLSINYVAKTLSISGGNSVSIAGLGVANYLGEVAADPATPTNGQYWWNTTSSELKIRVNSTTRVITTT
jgi:hypothetical protein